MLEDKTTNKNSYYFISYSRSEKARVKKYLHSMNKKNLPIWYDENIKIGSDWESVIGEKIKNCESVIMFISYKAFDNDESYVHREYRIAKEFLNKKIIVVLLDKIQSKDIPGNLLPWWEKITRYQLIEAYNYKSEDDCVNEIINAVSDDEITPLPPVPKNPQKKFNPKYLLVIAGVLAVILLSASIFKKPQTNPLTIINIPSDTQTSTTEVPTYNLAKKTTTTSSASKKSKTSDFNSQKTKEITASTAAKTEEKSSTTLLTKPENISTPKTTTTTTTTKEAKKTVSAYAVNAGPTVTRTDRNALIYANTSFPAVNVEIVANGKKQTFSDTIKKCNSDRTEWIYDAAFYAEDDYIIYVKAYYDNTHFVESTSFNLSYHNKTVSIEN